MHVRRAFRGLLVPALITGLIVVLLPGAIEAQWVQTNGPKGGSVRSLLTVPNGAGGTRLYAGQIHIWRTDDGGTSWSLLNNGLTDPNPSALLAVPNGSGGNDLLVGTNGGVFRSTDNGASWAPINTGITNLSVYCLGSGPDGSGGTNLYAGCYMGNTYRSNNNGASWTSINNGLPTGYNVGALITTASGTVLAASMNGIYRSTNFGASWMRVFTNHYAFSFAKHGTTLYAGTGFGVHRSTDDGLTWTPINTGMSGTWIYGLAAVPNGSGVTLFALSGSVWRSTNNGASWAVVHNGPSAYSIATAPNASGGTDLYIGTGDGVFRSSDNGDSWTHPSFVFSLVRALEVTPTGRALAGTDQDTYRSNDLGASWVDTQQGFHAEDFTINHQSPSGTSIFASSPLAGIIKSTDDGVSWNPAVDGLVDQEVNSVAAVPNGSGGTNLLAGTYNGLFFSTNDGGYWQQIASLVDIVHLAFTVTPNGSGGHNIFAGGFGGVWISTNGGTAWTQRSAGLDLGPVQTLAATANGANLFAGGENFGVYRSTNNGVGWTLANIGLSDLRITSLLSPDGVHLFAGGVGGVYLSTDHGNSWSPVGDGLTAGVFSLAVSPDGTTLLAGTMRYGVWKRPLAEMIDVLAVDSDGVTSGMALRANYPNPFQSGTTIQYALPQTMRVRLVVQDVAGRTVRVLADGVQAAGERSAAWDGRDARGSRVGAGLYLVRLEAGEAVLTRKMSLVR